MPATTSAAEVAPAAPANCPLRIGTAEDFARVRKFLQDAGYREEPLRRALEIPDISDLLLVDWANTPLDALSPELRLFLKLFVRTEPHSESDIAPVWGVETLTAFRLLGLLRDSKTRAGHVVPTVLLSPIADFVVASDLSHDPDGGELEAFDDVVFRPLQRLTQEFLRFLPDVRNGDALDLCGGCGIGALQLARTARVAVTTDLTPRSAFFAEFNGRLNGSPIVSRCGDLYAPVEGRQFDLISEHPPYVPSIGRSLIYRDGGEVGETIVRRTIEGLARYLRPGGTCVIVGLGRDTNAQPFEQRARGWLGVAAHEFDIIFGMERARSVEDVVESQRVWIKGDTAELNRMSRRLRDLDTDQFVHGVLYIRRTASPVTSPPLRLHVTPRASPLDFDRLFAWRARRAQPGFQDWLAGSRPRLASHTELHVRHAVEDGGFTVSEAVFRIGREFESVLQPDRWLVPVISKLNGRVSVADVFHASHAAGELPQEFPLEPFVQLVDFMIERGFLQIDLPD